MPAWSLRLVPRGRCPCPILGRNSLIGAVGILVVLTCLPAAEAASTGYGAAGATLGAATCWTGSFTLVNVNTSDDAWATCPSPGTNNGRLSTFGFVIPSSATITGIEVEVEGNDGLGGTVTYAVQLSWDNNRTGPHSGRYLHWDDGYDHQSWAGRRTTGATPLERRGTRRCHVPASDPTDCRRQPRLDRIRVRVHYTLASRRPTSTARWASARPT